jgi:hypothetical protein
MDDDHVYLHPRACARQRSSRAMLAAERTRTCRECARGYAIGCCVVKLTYIPQ